MFVLPVLLAGLLVTSAKQLKADDKLEVIRQANLEYSSGYYDHALELYLSIADQGYASPELYYNIGNAYFKLNRIPEAVLYYERAYKLAPRDENIRFNLELARTRTIDKIESVPVMFYVRWYQSLVSIFDADGWGTLSLILFISSLLLAAIFLLTPRRWLRVLTFYSALILIFISISAFALGYLQHRERVNRTEAIVFDPSVTVKSSPSDASIDLFVIHEGTKVKITDQVGEWFEIRIASGSMGWVRAASVEKI